uniref:Transmembrane protein n=1 Tax=Noccaea caerulescens TaxID=107243 RepID=A0A1J3GZ23_NOCCA
MKFSVFSVFVFVALAFAFVSFPSSVALSRDSSSAAAQDPLKLILGSPNFGSWKGVISADSLAPGPSSDFSDYLVLAADRTKRPDILRAFKPYRGGWNITNNHYWASVGFTGAPGFILAAVWILSFGSLLVVYHCCKWRVREKARGSSYNSRRICLILLIVFTCAAAVGCILLSVGQNKFHTEALHTLKYVVNQSDYTVGILQNVTQYLSLAKTINVTRFSLPTNVLGEIDKLNVNLNNAAITLQETTTDNAAKIKRVFYAVRSALIAVATVMLILSFLGFLLSLLRHQHVVHIIVVSGWILVAVTFILCGVFLILNNAISDTCVAMKEWVDNPHAETALSSILPCVDEQTTNQTLAQSKVVINSIVTVVNTFVYAYANTNPSPNQDHYYNQSGPSMPPLCSPFDGNMEDRQCSPQELSIANASSVWESYICEVSQTGICTTVGRVTPEIYGQLVAAVNESYALEHYTPPLLSFRDCNFVRDTFESITSDYCPPLVRNLRIVNAGLGLISVGVLLCLVLWVFYANRPQREEVFADPRPQVKDGPFVNALDNHHHTGDEAKLSA